LEKTKPEQKRRNQRISGLIPYSCCKLGRPVTLQDALFVLTHSCCNFIIFCRTEIQKNRTGEEKMLQKSQKKQQGHKKSYRNRKIRYWKTKKLTGKGKRVKGLKVSFPGIA
jgi:hypothetical protein